MNYEQKYLKYKAKYLKNKQEGGEHGLKIFFVNQKDIDSITQYSNINIRFPGKKVIDPKGKLTSKDISAATQFIKSKLTPTPTPTTTPTPTPAIANTDYFIKSFPYIIEKTTILHTPTEKAKTLDIKKLAPQAPQALQLSNGFNYYKKSHLEFVINKINEPKSDEEKKNKLILIRGGLYIGTYNYDPTNNEINGDPFKIVIDIVIDKPLETE